MAAAAEGMEGIDIMSEEGIVSENANLDPTPAQEVIDLYIAFTPDEWGRMQAVGTIEPSMFDYCSSNFFWLFQEGEDAVRFAHQKLTKHATLRKQKIIYTRLSLSEEDDAKETKHQMDNLAKIFGSQLGLRPVLDSMEEKMLGFRRQLLDTDD